MRVWSHAVLDADAATALFAQPSPPAAAAPGLQLYYPCNERAATSGSQVVDVSGLGHHAYLGRLDAQLSGSDGVLARFPTYVASVAAAFGNAPAAADEDQAVTVRLQGATADGRGAVTFQIATLPANGKLFDLDAMGVVGAEVTSVPTNLAAAAVRFVPNADVAGLPFDVFKYRTEDAISGALSYKTGVVLSVTSVDDAPIATAIAITANRAAAARINLAATHPSAETAAAGGALLYSISRLPTRGVLFRAAVAAGSSTTTAGEAIASVPFHLDPSAAAIIYVPSAPFGSGNNYDSLGYQVITRTNIVTRPSRRVAPAL